MKHTINRDSQTIIYLAYRWYLWQLGYGLIEGTLIMKWFTYKMSREKSLSLVSDVFVHLDVAGAVRLVWSHTVVSSISPVCRKWSINMRRYWPMLLKLNPDAWPSLSATCLWSRNSSLSESNKPYMINLVHFKGAFQWFSIALWRKLDLLGTYSNKDGQKWSSRGRDILTFSPCYR